MIHNIKLPDGTIKVVDCKLGSGIKDKNGVEIYEGDVIQFTNGSIYAVKFVKGSFIATDGWGFHDLATLKTSEAEIVGHVND